MKHRMLWKITLGFACMLCLPMGQSLHAQPLFDNPAPQQMFQRQHFGLLGPVQEVLIEMASFTMDENMDWVPVNRQPVEMLRFDVQGYVTETETYDFMGQLEERSVFTRTGNLVTLQTVYDGSQSLLNIIEYNYSNQKLTEEIVRSGSGELDRTLGICLPHPHLDGQPPLRLHRELAGLERMERRTTQQNVNVPLRCRQHPPLQIHPRYRRAGTRKPALRRPTCLSHARSFHL